MERKEALKAVIQGSKNKLFYLELEEAVSYLPKGALFMLWYGFIHDQPIIELIPNIEKNDKIIENDKFHIDYCLDAMGIDPSDILFGTVNVHKEDDLFIYNSTSNKYISITAPKEITSIRVMDGFIGLNKSVEELKELINNEIDYYLCSDYADIILDAIHNSQL